MWATEGRNAASLQAFFDQLTDEQQASIRAVSIDMSAGYEKAIRAPEGLPHARVCFDPFHVVSLGGKAADQVRDRLTRFPTDKHFASWAAQCPGNHQSAGKRKSGKTRKGPKWLDGALHDAAMGAIRVKDGHFARKYRRIKARSGHKIAIGSVKHAILIAIYHMLKNGELYHPPIVHPDTERKQHERTTKRLIAQLERLGHSVTLGTATSTAPAAAAP